MREAGYHVCQDLAARGLGIILLGHDASEQPFTKVLADATHEIAGEDMNVTIFDPPRHGGPSWKEFAEWAKDSCFSSAGNRS